MTLTRLISRVLCRSACDAMRCHAMPCHVVLIGNRARATWRLARIRTRSAQHTSTADVAVRIGQHEHGRGALSGAVPVSNYRPPLAPFGVVHRSNLFLLLFFLLCCVFFSASFCVCAVQFDGDDGRRKTEHSGKDRAAPGSISDSISVPPAPILMHMRTCGRRTRWARVTL